MHRLVRLTQLPLALPVTLLFVLAPGCGSTSSDPDPGSAVDSGVDGRELDAGSLDAGSLDAGSLDAGELDAGSLDAGELDAGSLDAGEGPIVDASARSFRLTVETSGLGSGRIASLPEGIDCGESCEVTFPESTTVTLTATPEVGSTFDGWTGGGCSGTDPCVVDLAADTTVTASFSIARYTLQIERAGTGEGTVTSSPAGIDCGDTCAAELEHGAVVTLTAAAGSPSIFAGYDGAGCGASEVCEVTITGPTTVTATFAATYTAGNTTDIRGFASVPAHVLLGSRVTLPSAGTLLAFGIHSRGSDFRVRFALYTDEDGAPGTLVAQTDPAGTQVVGPSQEIPPTEVGVALPEGT